MVAGVPNISWRRSEPSRDEPEPLVERNRLPHPHLIRTSRRPTLAFDLVPFFPGRERGFE
jgi:hypothetical protein